jgi:hypothetical protein
MRTEKNSRELRATEAASRASFRQRPRSGSGPVVWCVGFRQRPPPPPPPERALCASPRPRQSPAAASMSRADSHQPGAAFRRLSPFGAPHLAGPIPRGPAKDCSTIRPASRQIPRDRCHRQGLRHNPTDRARFTQSAPVTPQPSCRNFAETSHPDVHPDPPPAPGAARGLRSFHVELFNSVPPDLAP